MNMRFVPSFTTMPKPSLAWRVAPSVLRTDQGPGDYGNRIQISSLVVVIIDWERPCSPYGTHTRVRDCVCQGKEIIIQQGVLGLHSDALHTHV